MSSGLSRERSLAAAGGAAAAPPKKGLDYKMAKKVAELTQVVHMLFMRNHEHEVELHALKRLYGAELQRAAEACEAKCSAAAEQARVQLDRAQDAEREREAALRAQHERDLAARDAEWARRLDAKEQQAAGNRLEVQHLRDLLIGAQRDIELLRKGALESADSRSGELQQREQDVERLTRALGAAERRARDAEQQARDADKASALAIKRLEAELQQRKSMLDEATTNGEVLRQRSAQLEADMRALKKELTRRDHELASLRRTSVGGSGGGGSTPATAAASSAAFNWESSDELERLRKEVQRYRLELRNREGNFNRMFTNAMPVLVDVRAGAYGGHGGIVGVSGMASGSVNGAGGDRGSETARLPVGQPASGSSRTTKAFSYALSQSFEDVAAEERRERSSGQRLPPMRVTDPGLKLTRALSETRHDSKDLLLQYSRKSTMS